jgi:hypothetical protein
MVPEAGYQGSKTALCEPVASPAAGQAAGAFRRTAWRVRPTRLGEVDLQFGNGTRPRIHFFASHLKYSRRVRVSLVQDPSILCPHSAHHCAIDFDGTTMAVHFWTSVSWK